MYGMSNTIRSVLPTPSNGVLFHVTGYGMRYLAIFDMEPEEVEKVTTILGNTPYERDKPEGEKSMIGHVTIGGVQLCLHSRPYLSKKKEDPPQEST